jgi:hypothetical protein
MQIQKSSPTDQLNVAPILDPAPVRRTNRARTPSTHSHPALHCARSTRQKKGEIAAGRRPHLFPAGRRPVGAS